MEKEFVQCDEYLLDFLSADEVESVLDAIFGLEGGAQVVFEYDHEGAALCRDFSFNQKDI